MSNETITITRRTIQISGNGIGFLIPKDVVDALQITKRNLVEISIRNTGMIAKEDTRRKKEEPIVPEPIPI